VATGEGRRLPHPQILFAALVFCLALPASATATIRYAAPAGTAMAAQCTTPATPCTINEAASGDGVVSADEVVIAPGDYSDTAGDLGPNHYVDPVADTIHGEAGVPRPVITLADVGNGGFGAFKVETGNTVSHLEIDTTAADTNIDLAGGIVDDLIAHSGSGASAPIVCRFTGTATLRDSACLSAADQARTVGSFLTGSGTATATLRNVTAVATGATGANAIDFAATDTVTLNLDAKSVIGQATGVGFDLYAEEYGSSTVTYTIDHSNYSGFGSQGTPTLVTTNNQTTDPALATDMVHQLPSSVTVNAGATDGSSGPADIDGQERTIGTAADIGADELGRPTNTLVSCNPNSILIAGETTCRATVLDTGPPGGGRPHGEALFSTDAAGGAFDPGSSCTLTVAGENGSSCQVTYTPSVAGTQQISVEFPGDDVREASNGSFNLGVTAPSTGGGSPPPAGTATTPATTKKCKKKKKKHSASAAKKKCKKKKRRPALAQS
jgi:hypothetical protein